MAKFLVLWHLQPGALMPELAKAVLKTQDYGKTMVKQGKVVSRYHIIGKHGGAWIYDVESNEELDRLLAQSPSYNYAHYEVIALAEMLDSTLLAQDKK